MKKSKKVYIYNEDGMVNECSSIAAAAQYAKLTPPTVMKYISLGIPHKKSRYLFSIDELLDAKVEEAFEKISKNEEQITEEKIDEKFPNYKNVDKNKKRLFVDNQQYEVSSKDKLVTYVPSSREAKKSLLKQMIWKKMEKRWLTLDKKIATLERQTFKELIDSI